MMDLVGFFKFLKIFPSILGVRLVRKIISDARQLARFSEGPIKEALIHDANTLKR